MFTPTSRPTRLVSLVMLGCLVLVLACDPLPDPSSVEQILNHAIDTLDTQSAQWQDTLRQTIDQLGTVATQTAHAVLADVQATYNGALGQTQSAAFCGADFVGHRLGQRLSAIRHKFFSQYPDAPVIPVVCTTNPGDHIDVGHTQLAVYYGYDFLEFRKTQPFTADLEYASGQVVKPQFGHIAIPSNYQLSVEFQTADWSNVDPSQGPQLVLKWGGQDVAKEGAQSQLPVIFPTPTPLPANPVLQRAIVNFHTQDEDRDHDTVIDIKIVRRDGVVLAHGQAPDEQYRDESRHPVDLVVDGQPRKSDLANAKILVHITPNGHDTWRFDWQVSLTMSDNSLPHPLDLGSATLTQDVRDRERPLPITYP